MLEKNYPKACKKLVKSCGSVSDMPGWSTYLNRDCDGGSLIELTDIDSVGNCITQCGLQVSCVAVVFDTDGHCTLKQNCTQLTFSEGKHTYRILGNDICIRFLHVFIRNPDFCEILS